MFLLRYTAAFLASVFFENIVLKGAQTLLAIYLGVGVALQYGNLRDTINAVVGHDVMPDALTLWIGAGILGCTIIFRLGHIEAMRRLCASRLLFGVPYVSSAPLNMFEKDPTSGVKTFQGTLYWFTAAKIHASNNPYKKDEGKDVEMAWSKIELYDLDSNYIDGWQDGRWEDNEMPSWGNNPPDYLPDKEKTRTLVANGRSNILCLAMKPIDDEFAYSLRGEDTASMDWTINAKKIPPGKYLLYLSVDGKGLTKAATTTVLPINPGSGKELDVQQTRFKVRKLRK
jgi:hypothetical protein